MKLSDYLKIASSDLNKKVQESIDPRLYLFCNFEPNDLWVCGADAIFVMSVQNLYKFAVDSCFIIKSYHDFVDRDHYNYFKRLPVLLDQINLLRAVIDHNQNSLDGWLEQKRMDDYDKWVIETIKKEKPTKPEDFSAMTQSLFSIARTLVSQMELFVDEVSQSAQKAELIEVWINKTLQWYTTNTKTEIYKGQLINAYIANAPINPSLNNSRVLTRKVKKWVEAAIFAPIDRELSAITDEIKSKEAALDPNSQMYRFWQSKVQKDAFAKIIADIQAGLVELQQKQSLVEDQKKALQEEVGSNCWKYYFNHLESQLRSTMKQLENNGVAYTLLPQDLLQEDIQLHFAGVHSPERDF